MMIFALNHPYYLFIFFEFFVFFYFPFYVRVVVVLRLHAVSRNPPAAVSYTLHAGAVEERAVAVAVFSVLCFLFLGLLSGYNWLQLNQCFSHGQKTFQVYVTKCIYCL
jgi:hypothetical protein